MTSELAEAVRAQTWFRSAMTGSHVMLIDALLQTERAAGGRGERDSVVQALEYASEQTWYTDGLDEREAVALRGFFQSYEASLSDRNAPQIGPVLGSTLEYNLMSVLDLPESDEIVVLVSAEDAELGRHALDLAVQWLPEVEAITGAFPYAFLHLTVTELPEQYAGLSYDEFISLAPDWVTPDVVIHELTHSTLYGIFPTWFEEGFAHFMEYHLTGRLAEGVAYFEEQLAYLDADSRLHLGARPGYNTYDEMTDRATGFLFLRGLYELSGVDAVVETIRSLRTRTFSGQDLLKHLVDSPDPEQRSRLRSYVCAAVTGTTHNYCDQ